MSRSQFRRGPACGPRSGRTFHPQVEQLESRALPDAGGFASLVNTGAFATDHVLVQFEAGYEPSQLLPPGLQLGEALPLLNNFYVVNVPDGWLAPQALESLQNNPHVRFAQPDYVVSLGQIPNDPSFPLDWGLHNIGQSGGLIDADIDAPEAWDTTTGTGRIIVAVIDTGIDYNHPDLAANMWVNTGETAGNGIDDDGDGYIDDVYGYNFVANTGNPMDDNSHGTHVAGTIGAIGNNALGVAGVDWDVQLMAVKFLDASGSGSTSNAIRALNFAVAHGAQISNNSWGGGGYSQALSDAIASARSHGHIFVAAAGNNGTNNDITPFYPANYNLDNVVSVAATDRLDLLASFSNYGASTVDLAAPGVSIYSTLPGNSYGYKSGTSMAAPHVTGALALVWDLHPSWTYSQVINQVLSSVDSLPLLSGRVATGGRLNVARAVGTAPPSLSINDASVTEGNSGTSTISFTVTLSAASSQTVTVNYATANGSAAAGSDYTAASGTLTFNPGDITKTIDVTVNSDTVAEADESFVVNLSGAVNATIGDSQGAGTIVNDDSAPALSIDSVSHSEGNSGTTSYTFTVTLSAASSQTVTVDHATADNSATAASSDYQSTSSTLVFNPGDTQQTITVFVNGDTTVEQTETFYVNLSNAVNATIDAGQGTGTIDNDDAPPITISIGNASVIEGNSGTVSAVFSCTLSAASADTITVDYATANGSATDGSDYLGAGSTITFAPGETSKTINVAVLGDALVEPDESFVVNLSNATNASIDSGQGAATIRNDDTAISIGDVTQRLSGNGTTNFVFTVTLAQPSALTVTVNFATANGTLRSPIGYNATSGTLTFAPGVTSQTITVKVKKGSVGDYFFVNLSGASNATLTDAQALGTIGSSSAGSGDNSSSSAADGSTNSAGACHPAANVVDSAAGSGGTPTSSAAGIGSGIAGGNPASPSDPLIHDLINAVFSRY